MAFFWGTTFLAIRIGIETFVRILLGMFSIFLIYQCSLSDLLIPEYRQGIFTLLLAILAWSIGTIFMKRASGKLIDHFNKCLHSNADCRCGFEFHSIRRYYRFFAFTIKHTKCFYNDLLALFGSVLGYAACSYFIT